MEQPLLVLIPGMMCDQRLFESQIVALKKDAEVVVADIGLHDTMSAIAKNILASIKKPIFSVCGLSMGGIIAMEMLKYASDRIEKVALLDTNHLAEAADRQSIRKQQIQAVQQGCLKSVLLEQMLPFYVYEQNSDQEEINKLVMSMALDLGEDVFYAQSKALALRDDYSQVLSHYSGKALVMCGENDQLCPPEKHQAMAALLKQSTQVVIPECGHLSTLEKPDHVNKHLYNWLFA